MQPLRLPRKIAIFYVNCVLDRLAPPVRERSVTIDLPDTGSADGVDAAQRAILSSAGSAQLTPSEAATLSGIVESKRRAIETIEHEQRVAALESRGMSERG